MQLVSTCLELVRNQFSVARKQAHIERCKQGSKTRQFLSDHFLQSKKDHSLQLFSIMYNTDFFIPGKSFVEACAQDLYKNVMEFVI